MNIFFQVVPCSSDIIFIDITSNLYRCDTKLIWIITPSATGGLTLGFCWTSCKTQVVLTEAFHQSLLPTYAFYGRGGPRLIMTDDADTEISCCNVKYLITKLLFTSVLFFLEAVTCSVFGMLPMQCTIGFHPTI